MSDESTTTISLSKDTRDEIFREKQTPDETYEDVLQRLLSSNDS